MTTDIFGPRVDEDPKVWARRMKTSELVRWLARYDGHAMTVIYQSVCEELDRRVPRPFL